MKKILFLGSKDKSDLVMYLGLILNEIGLKTLIVDTSPNKRYLRTYTRFQDELEICDFFNVDIASVTSWKEVSTILESVDEQQNQYDFVLVDIEKIQLQEGWANFDDRYYVGNHEKVTLLDDAKLLKEYTSKQKEDTEFNKVIFYIDSDVDESYLDELIGHAVKWSVDYYEIPYDDFDLSNKIDMQYNMMPTFKKLSKDYRKTLASIVTAISGYHEKDTKHAIKQLERGFKA